MCEARVYLHNTDESNLIMRDVVRIEPEGSAAGTLVLAAIFGEQKLIDGHIVSIDFLSHTVVIEPSTPKQA